MPRAREVSCPARGILRKSGMTVEHTAANMKGQGKMTETLKRFDPIQHYEMGGSGYGEMKECSDGDYVRFDDLQTQFGWVTDRAPTDADSENSSGRCVEVTYTNGLLGWEPSWELRDWCKGKKNTSVIAWRKIREAFLEAMDNG